MNLDIIKIGNSKGIRIPSQVLKKYKIQDKINMEFDDDKIVLKPVKKPRDNWDKEFRIMSQNNDDTLLIDDLLPVEEEEWEWE